jgi:hypothetical protein
MWTNDVLSEGGSKTMKIVRNLVLLGLSFCVLGVAPSMAKSGPQASSIGLIARTTGGQIGTASAAEGASVFTGDYLTTTDTGTMLVRFGNLSLELQNSTGVRVYSAPYGIVAELDHGTALYTTPGGVQNLVIVASDVRVTPVLSTPDFGRVSLDDPCNVTVSSQRGSTNVQVGSENRLIEQNKSYRVRAENQLHYRKYLSPDADDYHDYHDHQPCAPLAMTHGHAPIAAGQSRFLLVTAVLVGAGTGVGIYKALESPDRP